MNRRSAPGERRTGAWFVHAGASESQHESTTSAALKRVQNSRAIQHTEDSLPLTSRAREQSAANNNFPFSAHDNRHSLRNTREYFNLGLGRKKVEPERRKQNSQNFFLWAHEPVSSSNNGLTIYQTSFLKDQKTESPFCRRYPKHHLEKHNADKPVPENEKKPSAKQVTLVIKTP